MHCSISHLGLPESLKSIKGRGLIIRRSEPYVSRPGYLFLTQIPGRGYRHGRRAATSLCHFLKSAGGSSPLSSAPSFRPFAQIRSTRMSALHPDSASPSQRPSGGANVSARSFNSSHPVSRGTPACGAPSRLPLHLPQAFANDRTPPEPNRPVLRPTPEFPFARALCVLARRIRHAPIPP